MLKTLLFLLAAFLAPPLFAQKACVDVFQSKAQNRSANKFEDFENAMSRGMLVHPHQAELLYTYLLKNFGGTSGLHELFSILQKYPELKKPHFREYQVSYKRPFNKVPPKVAKFIRSQLELSTLVQSRVLNPEDNLEFWHQAFSEQPLQPLDRKSFLLRLQAIFSTAEAKAGLSDYEKSSTDPHSIYTLRKMLKILIEINIWMKEVKLNTKILNQTIADFVHTAFFSDPKIQERLKSLDTEEVLKGLRAIAKEIRSRFQWSLPKGFEDLETLWKAFEIPNPTGMQPQETFDQCIERMRLKMLSAGISFGPTETYRLRTLSLQEAPFRGCIGRDCSTATYFEKALEPGSYHFTLTDQKNISHGHVTIVLGEAFDPQLRKMQRIAFIDKFQNFKTIEIPIVLNLVAQSLSEAGYVLAIPKNLENRHRLSSWENVYIFFETSVLPKLKRKYENYVPEEYPFGFKNGNYSRIYDRLDVYAIEPLEMGSEVTIQRGPIYQSYYADPSLGSEIIPNELRNLDKKR